MSITVKSKQSIIVSGTGESKPSAFSDALSHVQKEILKQSPDVILRIEPNDITVLSAKEQTYVEYFMFFFLPRKHKKYAVKLQVYLEIIKIDFQAVEFINDEIQSPNKIKLPFFTKKI